MQPRLAPLLSRALVAQPIAERLEYDQREPDLLRLPHPALSFDPRRVEEVMHQARQIKDHRHPMVRMARIEFGAEHLTCDPPMRGEGVEPSRSRAGTCSVGRAGYTTAGRLARETCSPPFSAKRRASAAWPSLGRLS